MNALVNALNQRDLLIFAQKADPSKQTVSAMGEDGKRYFLTQVKTIFVDAAGVQTEKFMWNKGVAMRPIAAPIQPEQAPLPVQ